MEIALIVIGLIVFFFALIALFTSVFTVEQQTIAIVERFGKFARFAEPGLQWKTLRTTNMAVPLFGMGAILRLFTPAGSDDSRPAARCPGGREPLACTWTIRRRS